jgi:hypothetical protein
MKTIVKAAAVLLLLTGAASADFDANGTWRPSGDGAYPTWQDQARQAEIDRQRAEMNERLRMIEITQETIQMQQIQDEAAQMQRERMRER